MALGTIVGAAIGAGASMLGSKKAAKSASDQAMMNYLMQKEFAQSGIQWRVEDAKKAGLHPLYALGGSGAAFSPNPIVQSDGGLEAAGQAVGQAVSKGLDPMQRKIAEAELQRLVAAADKDFAQAALARSERNRLDADVQVFPLANQNEWQMMENQIRPLPPVTGGIAGQQDQVKNLPVDQYSSKSGSAHVAAGNHITFTEATINQQGKYKTSLLMPTDGSGRIMEEMPIHMLGSWVAANVSRYGLAGFVSRYVTGSEFAGWDSEVFRILRDQFGWKK